MNRRLLSIPAAAAALGLIAAGLSCGSRREPLARHLVVVSIDTLRADRLGSYGQPQRTSPFLDRLARRSVQFAEAVSASSWTGAAHMSLFAGVEPQAHGLVSYPFIERLEYPGLLLAELLQDAGFATAAFHGGAPLIGEVGFSRGFDVFESHGLHFADGYEPMLAWVRQHRDERMFLFLHGFDVHQPYCPPRQYSSEFTDARASLDLQAFCRQTVDWAGDRVNELELDFVTGQYKGNLRTHDPVLSTILYALSELGVLDEALLVVTSDHGEAFYEHGRCGHAHGLYDELLLVPLLLRFPHEAHAGRLVDTPVATMDLMPTALEALGLPVPGDVRGQSLLPLARGESRPEQPVLGATGFPSNWDMLNCQKFVRFDRWKLVHSRSLGGLQRWQLYDLVSDPAESVNLADALPQKVAELRALLEAVPRLGRRGSPVELSDEALENLHSLGYVDGGSPGGSAGLVSTCD